MKYFRFKNKLLSATLTTCLLMVSGNVAYAEYTDGNFAAANINDATIPTSKSRLWNLQDVDIHQVAAEVSRETGKNFLIDPRVTGKISIISSTAMSSDEVYQMFLSMLQVLGFTVVPSGDVYKIMPLSGSVSQSLPVASNSHPGKGDELVVRVIPIAHVSASKLVPILRPLIPDTGGISAYFPANSLIITSTARNIDRLMKVIADLDKADNGRVEIVALYNANADQVVSTLSAMQPDTADESHITLAADNHSNSVLMSGDSQGRTKMRALIKRLDMPAPEGFEGNTQVIYLHYLKAAKFAPTLSKVAQNNSSGGGDNKDGNNQVNIQAEPSTNALIITAPPAIMHNLQSVVARLDIRPAQVLVEAAIVEIDDGTLRRLGVQWGMISSENARANGSNSAANAFSSVDTGGADDTAQANALITGSLPVGYNQGIGVIKAGDFRAIVTMLQQSQTTDILSTPSIVVMDNQVAKIDVGKTLSIQTGSYATTGTSTSPEPFNTFNRENIGLHLYVTPQINRGDAVQLKIDQGNSTLTNPVNPGTTPITNNSGIKTTVMVNTGDILVLGGLISNNQQEGETKIPILGDIPLVGKLFQYHTHAYIKKNLMVFLKPIILYNGQNSTFVTNSKYNYMREQEMHWENKEKNITPSSLPANSKLSLPSPFSGSGMINSSKR